MRFRLMATYRGVPYEVGVGPSNSDVVLFAACPPPEELGFEPAPGHWRKHVIRAEVDVLWESRPVGSFHGDPCLVLDDLGDRLHIAYLGKDGRRARELGYWQVDRGVYELLTPRDEVTGLTEEKAEQSLPRRGPVNGAQQTPSYPYGSPQWPPSPASAGPLDPRGRDGGAGYPGDPAMAPAGAWNGNGAPAGTGNWNGNGIPPGPPGPGWNGNGRPADTGGWNRDGSPADTGGWNRNGAPVPAPGGNWNRNGSPADTGGWNGNGAPAGTGGWNGDGSPADTGGWNRNGAPVPAPRRELERQRRARDGGRGERARHGQLEWHGRPGRDARRTRSTRPGTQAAGTEARPAIRPQAAGSYPGDLLRARGPGVDPPVGLRAGAGIRRGDVPAADRGRIRGLQRGRWLPARGALLRRRGSGVLLPVRCPGRGGRAQRLADTAPLTGGRSGFTSSQDRPRAPHTAAGETISAPSRRRPRAVLALMVPSGTSSRAAISRWVRSA